MKFITSLMLAELVGPAKLVKMVKHTLSVIHRVAIVIYKEPDIRLFCILWLTRGLYVIIL